MTQRTRAELKDFFLPVAQANHNQFGDLIDSVGLVGDLDVRLESAVITFASATQTITLAGTGAVLLKRAYIVRTVAWNGTAPTCTLGLTALGSELVTSAQANLDAAVPAGHGAGVEEVVLNEYTTDHTLYLTLAHGGATAGAGQLVVEYLNLA